VWSGGRDQSGAVAAGILNRLVFGEFEIPDYRLAIHDLSRGDGAALSMAGSEFYAEVLTLRGVSPMLTRTGSPD
jgi:hypothetical protein